MKFASGYPFPPTIHRLTRKMLTPAVFSVAVGAVSYRFFEMPFIYAKRRVPVRPQRQPDELPEVTAPPKPAQERER